MHIVYGMGLLLYVFKYIDYVVRECIKTLITKLQSIVCIVLAFKLADKL